MTVETQTPKPAPRTDGKSDAAFRTISEVARELDLPQHVLRFWETKFTQIKPLKRGGGRRYYRPEDMVLLRRIRELLYDDGYTIRGVQKLLRGNGARAFAADGARAADAAKTEEKGLETAQRAELAALLEELEALRAILRSAARKTARPVAGRKKPA
ncbi:MAG: MerR family transcriptional regulator [Rhodospirillales bacterium]|jgi:DNA-binding transcriptional MerR regulator|nr:MerR family transcriptional regulator [Rhodospirillales bacterium]